MGKEIMPAVAVGNQPQTVSGVIDICAIIIIIYRQNEGGCSVDLGSGSGILPCIAGEPGNSAMFTSRQKPVRSKNE
jgi:hypothetical protein